MGCRILYDNVNDLACLYCSTSDHAFGPVFSSDADAGREADERTKAFLRWVEQTPTWPTYDHHDIGGGRRDPRTLTDAGLSRAYSDWLAQEADQWRREDAGECEGCGGPAGDGGGGALCPACLTNQLDRR